MLLAAVRPVQLLIGKVLGIGLLALGQAAAMVIVFIVAGFATGSSLVHGAALDIVLAGAVFVVLGYAFYCTAFAAAGSLVSRQADVNSTVLYASGDVPLWQVVGSAMICAAGTLWMARLATRIYTQSILRTGPRIRLSQALRRNGISA